MLADALKELMKKKSLRKITVQNITDQSKLNRQTFYYHFKDVYDLLGWIYKTGISSYINSDGSKDWQSLLVHTIKYARKNKSFVRNTIRSLRKEAVEKFLYPFVHDWTVLFFNDTCGNIMMRQSDKDFVMELYTFAFIGMGLEWIGQGMKEDEYYWIDKTQTMASLLLQLDSLYSVKRPAQYNFCLQAEKV